MRQIIGDKKASTWDFFPQHRQNRQPKAVKADDRRAAMKAYIEFQRTSGGQQ